MTRPRILFSCLAVLMATTANAQSNTTTITEPGVYKLDELFKVADVVAVVKVLSGDMENYEKAVYKGEVIESFKGIAAGQTLTFVRVLKCCALPSCNLLELQAYTFPPVYNMTIGSRTRFTPRLVGLLALLMLIIFALYAALAKVTDDALVVLVLILVLTPLRRLLDREARVMWAVFLTKDSAYGRITESGIEYNDFFRHCADWSQIR